MKLTKRIIDKATYTAAAGKKLILWDDVVTGLGLRVYPSGHKAFVFQYYTVYRRKRLMTLGDYGVLTLDMAREDAREKRRIVLKGGDPLKDRQDKRNSATFAELAEAYLEQYAKPIKKTWKQDQSRINHHLLPAWRNHKAAAITQADVNALHFKIGKTRPYQANRTVELVSIIFEQGRLMGLLPKDHENPAKGIKHYAEKKRDRWVKPAELPGLAQAIDEEESPYARAALWLYLLTGARKSELLAARWDQIDFNERVLYLPETKAGRSHDIPLSAPAITIIEQIPRLEGNPHLFPGNKPGAHLYDLKKPWERVRAKAGIEDVRLHDLRRTVGSWLAQSGNTLHLIGRVLNHSNQSTTAVYARFGEDHVRAALESHAQRLLGVAGKIPAADVVELKK